MLGIAVLAAMFGIYVVANVWAASPRGRRSKRWIEECDLDDATDLSDAVDRFADGASHHGHMEMADHGHEGHPDVIGHLFDHL